MEVIFSEISGIFGYKCTNTGNTTDEEKFGDDFCNISQSNFSAVFENKIISGQQIVACAETDCIKTNSIVSDEQDIEQNPDETFHETNNSDCKLSINNEESTGEKEVICSEISDVFGYKYIDTYMGNTRDEKQSDDFCNNSQSNFPDVFKNKMLSGQQILASTESNNLKTNSVTSTGQGIDINTDDMFHKTSISECKLSTDNEESTGEMGVFFSEISDILGYKNIDKYMGRKNGEKKCGDGFCNISQSNFPAAFENEMLSGQQILSSAECNCIKTNSITSDGKGTDINTDETFHETNVSKSNLSTETVMGVIFSEISDIFGYKYIDTYMGNTTDDKKYGDEFCNISQPNFPAVFKNKIISGQQIVASAESDCIKTNSLASIKQGIEQNPDETYHETNNSDCKLSTGNEECTGEKGVIFSKISDILGYKYIKTYVGNTTDDKKCGDDFCNISQPNFPAVFENKIISGQQSDCIKTNSLASNEQDIKQTSDEKFLETNNSECKLSTDNKECTGEIGVIFSKISELFGYKNKDTYMRKTTDEKICGDDFCDTSQSNFPAPLQNRIMSGQPMVASAESDCTKTNYITSDGQGIDLNPDETFHETINSKSKLSTDNEECTGEMGVIFSKISGIFGYKNIDTYMENTRDEKKSDDFCNISQSKFPAAFENKMLQILASIKSNYIKPNSITSEGQGIDINPDQMSHETSISKCKFSTENEECTGEKEVIFSEISDIFGYKKIDTHMGNTTDEKKCDDDFCNISQSNFPAAFENKLMSGQQIVASAESNSIKTNSVTTAGQGTNINPDEMFHEINISECKLSTEKDESLISNTMPEGKNNRKFEDKGMNSIFSDRTRELNRDLYETVLNSCGILADSKALSKSNVTVKTTMTENPDGSYEYICRVMDGKGNEKTTHMSIDSNGLKTTTVTWEKKTL